MRYEKPVTLQTALRWVWSKRTDNIWSYSSTDNLQNKQCYIDKYIYRFPPSVFPFVFKDIYKHMRYFTSANDILKKDYRTPLLRNANAVKLQFWLFESQLSCTMVNTCFVKANNIVLERCQHLEAREGFCHWVTKM